MDHPPPFFICKALAALLGAEPRAVGREVELESEPRGGVQPRLGSGGVDAGVKAGARDERGAAPIEGLATDGLPPDP